MRPKTVMVVVTSEFTANTFLVGYLKFLEDKGWRVTLITSFNNGTSRFMSTTKIAAVDIAMQREPSPLRDVISFLKLLRVLSKARPSVVVAATPKASLLAMIASRVVRVRTRVYLLWGIRLETASGVYRKILKVAEKVTVACSTIVFANSDSLAQAAIDLRIVSEDKVSVLGHGSSHGVDLDRYSSAADIPPLDQATRAFLREDPPAITIGFVGRIHQDKGIDTLVEALRILRSTPLFYRVLFVGPEEDNRTAQLIRNSDLKYHMAGPVSDVRPYLNVMDIHCLPSRREGYPNAVLEASGMGVATVASDATGVIDSVVDGQTGIIFKAGDAKSLANALEELACNKEKRGKQGRNARLHVEANYRQEDVWSVNENALSMMLSKK